MAERHIEYMDIDALEDATRNPKDHDPETLGKSMDRFGYLQSIFLDERTGRVVAGHGRRDKLREMRSAGSAPPDDVRLAEDGRWLVPVERGWSSKDDADAEAAGIALNRVGEGRWHRDLLWEMLDERSHLDGGLDGLGFVDADLDAMLKAREMDDARMREEQDRVADATPVRTVIRPPDHPTTTPGDVWILDEHRLGCGDCRDADFVREVVGDRMVNVAFTSPPYASQRDYDASSGFTPILEDEYVEWFAPVAANVADVLTDDGSWFVNIKPAARDLDTHLYVLDLVIAHVREWGWHFATEFCWERVGVPKHVTRRFKNQFEPVYQFTRGDWKMRPDHVRHLSDNEIIPLGEGAAELIRSAGSDANWKNMQGTGEYFPSVGVRRHRHGRSGNVADLQGSGDYELGAASVEGLAYPGNRLPTFAGTHEATGHSAAFPVGLPRFFVRAFSDEGDVIFDPFCGSGSTILAAHGEGRIGVGIEISPAYCDIAVARIQRQTGIVPILERTGEAVDILSMMSNESSEEQPTT